MRIKQDNLFVECLLYAKLHTQLQGYYCSLGTDRRRADKSTGNGQSVSRAQTGKAQALGEPEERLIPTRKSKASWRRYLIKEENELARLREKDVPDRGSSLSKV